jgi:hypothetical protein
VQYPGGRRLKNTIERVLLMHDVRALLDLGGEAVRRLARRGYALDLATIEAPFL